MAPNIFKVDPRLGSENRLTSFWHYVLSVIPGIGQAFIDQVATQAGLAPSRFLGALDHPSGDQYNHPDLLIQTDNYNLLFEHKLGSPLGPRQLERYLDLAEQKDWKLALLASQRHQIDESVRSSDRFVFPKTAGSPPHFLWQDIHALLATSTNHLALEFGEYLQEIGLGRFTWAGLGNPFIDENAANELRSLYDALKIKFQAPGVVFVKSANSLIYQIRKPFPPVHLVNIGPLQTVAQFDPGIRGPVMAMWVWVRRPVGSGLRMLPRAEETVAGSSPCISVYDIDDPGFLPKEENVFAERYYYVPLDKVLTTSRESAQGHLIDFATAAMTHLQQDGLRIAQGGYTL